MRPLNRNGGTRPFRPLDKAPTQRKCQIGVLTFRPSIERARGGGATYLMARAGNGGSAACIGLSCLYWTLAACCPWWLARWGDSLAEEHRTYQTPCYKAAR